MAKIKTTRKPNVQPSKKPLNQRSISYDIQLNEEQKEAKRTILENTVTILTGKAGSGKTIVAVATALDLYFKKEIKKINDITSLEEFITNFLHIQNITIFIPKQYIVEQLSTFFKRDVDLQACLIQQCGVDKAEDIRLNQSIRWNV